MSALAARNRRCGGGPQRKVGYLRTRHGKGSDTHKFKAARRYEANRQRLAALAVEIITYHAWQMARWQRRRALMRPVIIPSAWVPPHLISTPVGF